MSSIVYYTVQGDRDDPEHPNAFAIAKPYDRIVVGDVREAFPLSGTFHFRFKIKYEAFGHVWLDLTDDTRKVPICDGKITLKVLPMDATMAGGARTIPNARTAAVNAAAASPQAAAREPEPQRASTQDPFPQPAEENPFGQKPATASQHFPPPQTRERVDSEPLLDLGGPQPGKKDDLSGSLEDLFS